MRRPILCLLMTMAACQTDNGNEQLQTASEKLGKSAATAVKGIKAGIENVSKINIELSEGLKTRGIHTGKIKLDSKGGRHNAVNMYLIFDKKINRNVILKVYNTQNEEIGRTKVLLKAEANDAKYVEFVFNKNTNIDRDYRLILE